ncbi:MAG: hypothetical protein IJB74_05420 [Clostridia bacterium]|nr:hypothetical protein [Clostridia bacterium]
MFSKKWTPMTEDNCADYEFMNVVTEKTTLQTRLASLMRFITMLLQLFVKLINGEINLA